MQRPVPGSRLSRLEWALRWDDTIPQSTGDITEHPSINRGDLLREIYTMGIAPYEDPTMDRATRLNELDQRRKQRRQSNPRSFRGNKRP